LRFGLFTGEPQQFDQAGQWLHLVLLAVDRRLARLQRLVALAGQQLQPGEV
jgi:hypothetical protein